ncbi:MAG: ABC transporter ATP-binding protein [Alphaproteobacteria bacterium]|nr:ABC transporter ATP-binding protein [Alphaproteobacteria bacterium]
MTDAAAPLLELRDVTKRFGGLVAVRALSFAIHSGEVLGLIGPNGAGKSTTFNLIGGFYAPTAGEVLFESRRITGNEPHVAARMGIVRTFQHGSVFRDLTVRDNITVGATATVRGHAAREARVQETARMLGLEPRLDDPAHALPSGHQRLLSIAIALAARPILLCLDEPLAGLNPAETQEVLEVIARIRGELGVTVLLVEHNVGAVMRICDRIVVLNFGAKLAEGTPVEVRENEHVIDAYLGRAD